MSAPFQFRPYQEAHVQKGIEFFENGTRQNAVEVVPTGGGKSWIIGGIATNVEGETLVLQPSKEILEQNYRKALAFIRAAGLDENLLGVYSASFGMRQVRKITFATIGSIAEKPELFRHFRRIIMDECDLANAQGGQYERFFDDLGVPVLGLTDSPYRLYPPSGPHNSVIKFIHRTNPRIFESLLHVTQNRELFDAGYLTRPDYVEEEFYEEQLSFNSTGAEFSDRSLKDYTRDHDLLGKMMRFIRDVDSEQVLAVCNNLEEARSLQRRLCAVGPEPLVVHGEMDPDERKKAYDAFINVTVRCAIVCGMWTVGFDHPRLSAVCNGKITNSARLYKQIVGRGVRLHEDKKFFRYADFGGNVKRFGKVEEFEIVGPPGKERLKSGVGFLTGVDLKTRHDIEADVDGEGQFFKHLRSLSADGSYVIKGGKYKGQKIAAVPIGFLIWAMKEASDMGLRAQAVGEIKRRNKLKKGAGHG